MAGIRRRLGVMGVVALVSVLLVGAGDEQASTLDEVASAATTEQVAEPAAEEAAAEAVPEDEPASEPAAPAPKEGAPGEAAAEEPAAEAGVDDAPAEGAVAAEPAAEEPVAEELAAEEPVAEELAAEEPVAEEPAVAAPASRQVPVPRAPDKIEGKTHQGQSNPPGGGAGGYTSGNVVQYAEGDTINFRFTLTGNNPNLSGQMQVEFSKEDSGCAFFEPSLVLGTHDGFNPAVVPVSGTAPTVTLNGGVFSSGNDWVQKIDVSTTDANTEAVIYYYLTITDNVTGCTGSSQHSRLNESANPGAFTKTGQQNVPVPANQIIRFPEITVTKLIDRDGNGTFESTADAGEYEFTLDGSTTLPTDGAGQVVFMNVQPDGNHTITENQIDFTNGTYEYDSGSGANCTFDDPSETATANVLAGTINNVQHAECTFHNRPVKGKIIIEKQTLPDGSLQTFDFQGDVAGTLSDGQTAMAEVVPGQYTSTEVNIPTGWALTDISCDDNDSAGDVGTATATFNVASAETVTCTFTNTQNGKIVVEKQTLPDGDPETFDFSGDLNGTIGDDGMLMDDVAPGQYSVTEDPPPAGWTLTDVDCDDGNSTGNVGTATATFNVEPGETVTCTFTNTKDGKIVVEKQTLPDGDPETFDFSGDLVGTIGDGGMLMDDVSPGQYEVTEDNIPAGWTLASVNCDDLNSVGDAGNAKATFKVEPGETVTCVFNNTNLPTIVVQKQTLPDGDPRTFDFSGAINATLGDGDSDLTVVTVGQHLVTETVPAGWVLTDIICDDNDSTGDTNTGVATFNVGAGEVVTCVFTNTKDGEIVVEKQTLPNGDPQQFDFAGDLAGQIPDDGTISLPVQPGQYSTTETVPPGWVLTGIACTDGNSSGDINTGVATFNVEPGEQVTCVFTNTKNGSITVEKQTSPDGSPQQFTFAGDLAGQIPDDGTISLPVQPGQYSTTETVPAGWQLTGIACSDGNSVGDTLTATAMFDVSPGETVTCVFTNTQEGSITIVKDALPADGTDFAFDGAFGPFALDDDADATLPESVTFGGLLPGQYDVTEAVPAGWELIGLACDDGSAADLATATASIGLSAGEDVTCTFTNRQFGRIVVQKQTVPTGSALQFTFTPSYGAPFQLADGQNNVSGFLSAGQYSVAEQVPSGWDLTSATCDDGSAPGAVDLPAGETVTCTFVNTEQQPAIQIDKSPDTQTVAVGGTATFTIVVTNTGNVDLANVAVSDPNAPDCDATIGDLAVGGSDDYQCTVTITDDLTNVATATGEGPSQQPVQDDDDAFVNAIPTIGVDKSGTGSVEEPGGTATFTLVITNTSAPSDPVTVTSVVDSIHGDVIAAPGSTCTLPQTIQPGDSYSCSFTGVVTGQPGDSETDVVAVAATDDEGTPAEGSDDHVVTVTDLPSSIVVTKSASPTSVPETGADVTFTVTVANTSQADSVTITSVVDDVFGDVSSTCAPALPHVLVPQSTLTCSFTRFVSGSAADDHRDVATVTGTDDDGNPVSGDDDAVVDLTPVIDLAVTADFDPEAVVLDFDPAVDADEQSVLTVTVTNEGPSDASGVEAVVRLPAGVTYLSHGGAASAAATTSTFDPATGALVIGDLAVGATVTLRITVSVDETGGHVAVAEVTKANEPDVDSTPANGVLAEDDQDDALVTATQVLATASIGDTVFRDDDKDGVQDPAEPGIAGVSVVLTNVTTGATQTVVTNVTGKYVFSALPPGDYQVAVLLSTLPAGFTATTPTQMVVTLAENQEFLDADFAFALPPPQVLPRTGADTGSIVGFGLLMLALGALLVLAARRRRETAGVAAPHPLPRRRG